jgi:osmoprotectant transport system substrate-binding protein
MVVPTSASAQEGKPTVRIGSADFPEQVILGELYAQVLEANGYTVQRLFNLGSREIVAPAMESGQIDLVPEYLATYATYLNGGDSSMASTDADQTLTNLQGLANARGLTVLAYSPAVDTNALVVTGATASNYGLQNTSDLAQYNGQFVMGGPPECPTRPFCLLGYQNVYGLSFKDFRALDVGGPLTVAALDSGQIDVALLFSTNPQIAARGFVLLQDDGQLQLADNVAPVVRGDLLGMAPSDFVGLLNNVSAQITTDGLTGLIKQVAVDRADEKDVAKGWLSAKGLI